MTNDVCYAVNRSLDMAQYMSSGLQPSTGTAPDDMVYDLYGVVNHTGSLLGGHYTAYARTPHITARLKNELGMPVYSTDFHNIICYVFPKLVLVWLIVQQQV